VVNAAERRELLAENAAGYARVALENVQREFPHDLRYLVTGPEDRPGRPRELHPAFYGSLDWHSCVEMHWVLVRLLRLAPDRVPEAEARAVLDRHLSEAALAAEAAFVADPDNRMFERWYADDADYPGGWEPSGADFLSPALVEAELMAQLLEPAEFAGWLDRFLRGIAAGEPAALFRPAVVSDDTDGQIAHLHGLNLCRAWAWRRLAAALLDDDGRREPMLAAARRHAESALDRATGSDYMVEHWLAAYALLYLSD
jgi:hypothetical protein